MSSIASQAFAASTIADNLLSDSNIDCICIRHWLTQGAKSPRRTLFDVVKHLAAHPNGHAAILAADQLHSALRNTTLGHYDVVEMLMARVSFPDVEFVEKINDTVLVPRARKEEPQSKPPLADDEWDMCNA
jgi:hypothetical protein